jgi:hypothetical protein
LRAARVSWDLRAHRRREALDDTGKVSKVIGEENSLLTVQEAVSSGCQIVHLTHISAIDANAENSDVVGRILRIFRGGIGL